MGIANLVVTQSFERLFHPKSNTFGQMDRGVFLIRGENVVLLGEIVRRITQFQVDSINIRRAHSGLLRKQDLDLEDPPLEHLTQVSFASISALLASEKKAKSRNDKIAEQTLLTKHGFGAEGGEGDAYGTL